MRTILFLHFGKYSYLPPFQALVDYLLSTNQYNIKIVCSEHEVDSPDYINSNIEFTSFYSIENSSGLINRIHNRIKREKSKISLLKFLKNTEYDILWVIHEKTAIFYRFFLINKKYILSVYELRSKEEKFYRNLDKLCQKAAVNVVCEPNRAWITYNMYHLKEVPIVLPNKPYNHPRINNLVKLNFPSDKKVLLYQGILQRERNLDGICKAVENSKDYVLVIMGEKSDYLMELMKHNPNIIHINYIKPPKHLEVTSLAHIGIVTYSPECLNTIYCAPNKIWEFSGFGIPMLVNNIPGLKYSVELAGCAVCSDMDDPDMIIKSLGTIEAKYQLMSNNANIMFEKCDITSIIDKILDKYQHS